MSRAVRSLALWACLMCACVMPKAGKNPPADGWSERVAALGERSILRVISDGGGVGSGFIIHPSGLAVTNAHVVGGSNGGLAQSTEWTARYRVLATGPSRDLALLQVEGDGACSPLLLGDSDALPLGAPVLAIGAPQGMFPVVTTGVFGGRSVPGMIADTLVPEQLIHGAPTLRGSSGCPVLDSDGLVIGVQSAKPAKELVRAIEPKDEPAVLFDRDLNRWRFQTEAFGLAVPVADLVECMPAWISPEWSTGLETGFAAALDDGRVVLQSVSQGSPAELAGLVVGDVLVSVSGHPVLSPVDLAVRLSRSEGLQIEAQRGGERVSVFLRRKPWARPGAGALAPGLRFSRADKTLHRIPPIADLSLAPGGVIAEIEIPAGLANGDDFFLLLEGWVNVPEGGSWRFELTSDDGAQLYIRDKLVVDGDGLHSARGATGAIVLEPGFQPIRVLFFESAGEEVLRARWGLEGQELSAVPPGALWHSS